MRAQKSDRFCLPVCPGSPARVLFLFFSFVLYVPDIALVHPSVPTIDSLVKEKKLGAPTEGTHLLAAFANHRVRPHACSARACRFYEKGKEQNRATMVHLTLTSTQERRNMGLKTDWQGRGRREENCHGARMRQCSPTVYSHYGEGSTTRSVISLITQVSYGCAGKRVGGGRGGWSRPIPGRFQEL